MMYAALAYAGRGAVLSHETAGWLDRFCKQGAPIHITVPFDRVVAGQPGVKIHRSRDLTAAHVHPARTPRRTRIERTVCDLLAGAQDAEQALSIVADAIRTRITTAAKLRAALLDTRSTKWRKVALDALPNIDGGAHSVLELLDVPINRRHGLPQPERQFKRLPDGTEYLDGYLKAWSVHYEFDGRLGHDKAREIWRDHRRDNRSTVNRQRVLRYGWADLIDRGCEVAAERAVVLAQQGWPGAFRRCPRCPPNP